MNKSVIMFNIGEEPLENGMNILGAHIDSPRLDLKSNPLYEDTELAYFDTHYYGGVKKYQWVTIQAQILDLLRQLKDKVNSSIMLITHDLGVIAEMADYVVVMYAGRIVEKGTADDIFHHPAHPYTIGLMNSKPVVGKKVDKLYSIPGKVPNPVNMPNYCYFKDRCEMCLDRCSGEYPHEISLSDTHKVICYRYYDDNKKGE